MTMHNADRNTNLCEQAQELLPAYALGIADEDERAIVEAGLRACPDLQSELAQYDNLSEAMLYAAPQFAPPPQLGVNLMQRIAAPTAAPTILPPAVPVSVPLPTTQHSWWQRNARPAMAVAVASLILLLASNLYWWRETTGLRDQLTTLTPASPVLTFANTEDISHVSLTRQPDEPGGRLEWSPGVDSNTWIAWLSVEELPALTEGTYQLWLIREGESPYSAGIFNVADDGQGLLIFITAEPIAAFDFVGITAEPVGGSPAPTSDPVMQGAVQNSA